MVWSLIILVEVTLGETKSPELKNNREIVLAAVNNFGSALRYAPEQFQNDREIVLAAVNNNGLALRRVLPELRRDYEIILAAIKNNIDALEYVDENLFNSWNNKKTYLLSIDISNYDNILDKNITKSITKFLSI